ncbi:hypothetical protein E2C01_072925 [Portunus trituberculatus]|uniref:Uncharacterized protein n=1 Tax=Portunus trituberculatus TaxID=210409 RepID=A0A5B7I973_PORTR|nr:hypothetical protein [Portunus trituberculatus]
MPGTGGEAVPGASVGYSTTAPRTPPPAGFCIARGSVVILVMKGQMVPVAGQTDRRTDGRVCQPALSWLGQEWA